MSRQLNLFGQPEEEAKAGKKGGRGAAPVESVPVSETLHELAGRLPDDVRLGGSTWSFEGWTGLVYARRYSSSKLAKDGLAAYARHPLFRGVGIDRTHYRPLPPEDLAAYAAQVPEGFRFLVKAHEDLTLARFPERPRYGDRKGLANPLFLDPAYAADAVVGPYVEGLGEKAGALLFQFAPQPLEPGPFAESLYRFLTALPARTTVDGKARGPLYAVEVRNRSLLTADYRAALEAAGACHCGNVYPGMPPLAEQYRVAGLGPMLVVRWLVRPGYKYGEASRSFQPFNRMVAPDPERRDLLARMIARAHLRGVPSLVTVNNLAEGSAPLTIPELAAETVRALAAETSGRPEPAGAEPA